ncbi:hypothetical protein SNE40_016705 [Patella caerulea]|uniref:Phosphatidylglycerophosphatase and protein-tyrosine phosphatase 1 n=1 Tax=Patella caerulea TaxID=87958 RepID=A0AAN8JC31_PATCE
MLSVLSRIVFYPTLAFNGFMTRISNRQWYNRIDDTVVLGALPVKWISKQLIEEENIGGVISLNQEFELKRFVYTLEEWKQLSVTQLKIPTLDYIGAPSTADLKRGVDFILEHKKDQKSVYVHCKAGRTRSTTVVACYLMTVNNLSPEESLNFIKDKRPHVVLREPQYKALESYKQMLENSVK